MAVGVAPCVGAWVETSHVGKRDGSAPVAPCVGAWVETGAITDLWGGNLVSRPAWARGLKP